MLYFISWLTDFSAILFIFVSTRLLADQETSAQAMGYLGVAYFLVAGLANTISGRLADRIGKNRVSVTGTIVMTLAFAGVTVSEPSSIGFYVSYVTVGFALGVIYPPIMASLGHAKSGKGTMRTYLYFCLAFNGGIAAAQLSGGVIYQHVAPYAPFYIAMGAAALSAACFIFVRERDPADEEASPSDAGDYDADLSRLFSRVNWCANFSGMFSMSLIWFLLPKLIVQQEIDADVHGTLMACGRACTIGTFLLMYLVPKWPYRIGFVVIAHGFGLVGLLGIYASADALGFGLSVCVFSVLMGFNYYGSLYYSSTGATADEQGKAFGLNESFLMFGAVGGSLAGALLSGAETFRLPFLVAAVVVLASMFTQVVIWYRR